jgi:HSP20 family molecular chaperone IbpA
MSNYPDKYLWYTIPVGGLSRIVNTLSNEFEMTTTHSFSKKFIDKDERVTVSYLVPNVEKENVSVRLSGEHLIVEVKGTTQDFSPKDFTDYIPFKNSYDSEGISSKLENGVLKIEIPYKKSLVKDIQIV